MSVRILWGAQGSRRKVGFHHVYGRYDGVSGRRKSDGCRMYSVCLKSSHRLTLIHREKKTGNELAVSRHRSLCLFKEQCMRSSHGHWIIYHLSSDMKACEKGVRGGVYNATRPRTDYSQHKGTRPKWPREAIWPYASEATIDPRVRLLTRRDEKKMAEKVDETEIVARTSC